MTTSLVAVSTVVTTSAFSAGVSRMLRSVVLNRCPSGSGIFSMVTRRAERLTLGSRSRRRSWLWARGRVPDRAASRAAPRSAPATVVDAGRLGVTGDGEPDDGTRHEGRDERRQGDADQASTSGVLDDRLWRAEATAFTLSGLTTKHRVKHTPSARHIRFRQE